jgi:hypothetical protein
VTKRLSRRDRRDIERGHNELAVRAGLSRPARGYRFRVAMDGLLTMLTPSRVWWSASRRDEIDRGWAEYQQRLHGWKATSAWYQSFGGEQNYQREMTRLMARQHGVGPIIYAVERAIEDQLPTATEEEWHTLASRIVNEVICPVQQPDGVWRMYPITNADQAFGPREYESTRWVDTISDVGATETSPEEEP